MVGGFGGQGEDGGKEEEDGAVLEEGAKDLRPSTLVSRKTLAAAEERC